MADEHEHDCPAAGQDVLSIGPEIGNGYTPYMRHRPNGAIETGVGRAVQEGQPVHGKRLMYLEHRGPGPVFDITDSVDVPAAGDSKGPAMVATKGYCDGWDRIFGGSTPVGQA